MQLLSFVAVGCLVVQWSSAQNPLDEYSAGFIPINYLRQDDPCTDPTPCDQSSKIIKFFCVWDGQGPGILFHDMCFVDEFNCQYKKRYHQYMSLNMCRESGLKYNHNTGSSGAKLEQYLHKSQWF